MIQAGNCFIDYVQVKEVWRGDFFTRCLTLSIHWLMQAFLQHLKHQFRGLHVVLEIRDLLLKRRLVGNTHGIC